MVAGHPQHRAGARLVRKVPAAGRNSAIASVARRSLVAARAILEGEAFIADVTHGKRPGHGLSPMAYWDVLSRRAPARLRCRRANRTVSLPVIIIGAGGHARGRRRRPAGVRVRGARLHRAGSRACTAGRVLGLPIWATTARSAATPRRTCGWSTAWAVRVVSGGDANVQARLESQGWTFCDACGTRRPSCPRTRRSARACT